MQNTAIGPSNAVWLVAVCAGFALLAVGMVAVIYKWAQQYSARVQILEDYENLVRLDPAHPEYAAKVQATQHALLDYADRYYQCASGAIPDIELMVVHVGCRDMLKRVSSLNTL